MRLVDNVHAPDK